MHLKVVVVGAMKRLALTTLAPDPVLLTWDYYNQVLNDSMIPVNFRSVIFLIIIYYRVRSLALM